MFIKSIIDTIEKKGTVTVIAANSYGSGEEVFTLSLSEWRKFSKSFTLHEQDEVTEEMYDLLKEAAERTSCLITAARLLSASDKSSRSLERKLKEKGFSAEATSHAVNILKKKGYLNEEESCKNYALSAVRSKHYGKRRIVEYLVSHGYHTDDANAAADGIPDENYRAALIYNIERKCPDIASLTRAEQQKKIAALIRLGFSAGEVIDEIKELTKKTKKNQSQT
ncbi:MAG: hypothetical protein E7672_06655 [Ruminococcaceae bacterium]|nr:hypothetical protein [Oscillospiraceae bacterium]